MLLLEPAHSRVLLSTVDKELGVYQLLLVNLWLWFGTIIVLGHGSSDISSKIHLVTCSECKYLGSHL